MFPLLTDSRTLAAYSEGAGIYRVIPQAVAIPGDPADVAAIVRRAAAEHRTLIPRGAGSGIPGGNVGAGVILDLTRLDALEIDAGRRRARAGAGVTWARVNEGARAFGLRLPPDPASGAFATSGGMVSTNAAGPRSVRYGPVRGWVEGIQVVGADGDARWVRRGDPQGSLQLTDGHRHLLAQRFPRTRKNSSGYALDAYAGSGDEVDLFIGAEGTLGAVTAVEWRLDPIPPHTAGVALGFPDLAALNDAVPFLVGLDASAVELLDRTLLTFVNQAGGLIPASVECLLLVEFERDSAAAAQGSVADAVRGLKHLTVHVETAVDRAGLEQMWQIRRLASPALARLPGERRSLQVIEDGCVPLGRLADYLAGLRTAAARHDLTIVMFGHAGDGHVHVNVLPDLTRSNWLAALQGLYDEVTALLLELGGTPTGEHGDGRLRAGVVERFFGPELMALFRQVKRRYDPESIFNPGVILPSADWSPLADLKVGPNAAPIPGDIEHRLRDLERNAAWATPKVELTGSPDT